MRNQKGFTLIELIIVIVVLGILAVTAAPQFFNFSGDARTSTVKGLKGNIQGAYQTVYAKAAVDGSLGASDSVESINTVYGYPAATADGIVKAASLDSSEWVSLVDPDDSTVIYIGPADYIAASPTATDAFTDVNGDGSGGCYVSYDEATSANQPPVVAINTEACGN